MRAKRQHERREREREQELVEAKARQQERAFKKAVTHIARTLGEASAKPVAMIERIVTHLGVDQAFEYLRETEQIEAQGGMLLPDGSRRRTPGGVFFFLVKQRLQTEQRKDEIKAIFK